MFGPGVRTIPSDTSENAARLGRLSMTAILHGHVIAVLAEVEKATRMHGRFLA